MDITINLKENIKLIIAIHNLSQQKLGKVLGVTQKIVSNWVNGVSSVPLDKLIVIKERYGYSLDTLVFGEIGRPNHAYEEFVKTNHPDMVADKNTGYVNGILLNGSNANDEDTVINLVTWLMHHENELSDNKVFQLYLGNKKKEYLENFLKENLKNRLTDNEN